MVSIDIFSGGTGGLGRGDATADSTGFSGGGTCGRGLRGVTSKNTTQNSNFNSSDVYKQGSKFAGKIRSGAEL